MPFRIGTLPHKLIANEWLVDSVPSVWYRLSDAVPSISGWVPSMKQRVKHDWVFVCRESDERKDWYLNGKRHRESDLPAIEWADGTKWWILNGRMHRENDLPAEEEYDGGKKWWINGQQRRENGLHVVERANGIKLWCYNGQLYVL